jgi:hypothetical protein
MWQYLCAIQSRKAIIVVQYLHAQASSKLTKIQVPMTEKLRKYRSEQMQASKAKRRVVVFLAIRYTLITNTKRTIVS